MLEIILFMLLSVSAADPQAGGRWEAQTTGTRARLRGVSAVSDRVAWASGTGGTYARTVDGGRTWQTGVVPGAEELDFRDVDAFDAETAYLLAIGEGERSRIYKTTDGGRTWTLQFKNDEPTAFFDAMAFWDRQRGVAVSDPVRGRFLVVTTTDGGRTWKPVAPEGMPPALEGEGAFAASGTCVTVQGRTQVWFGTGGPNGARVFRSADSGRTWSVAEVPLARGRAAGVFSLVFTDERRGVAVGGDYTKEGGREGNAATTDDGGRTWRPVEGDARPGGYRSGVALAGEGKKRELIAVGPAGTDRSADGGRTWTRVGAEGFHAVSFRGGAGWAVGENGAAARYVFPRGK